MLVNKETLLKVHQKKVKKVDQVRYSKINQDILEVSELIKEIDNIENKGDKMDKVIVVVERKFNSGSHYFDLSFDNMQDAQIFIKAILLSSDIISTQIKGL